MFPQDRRLLLSPKPRMSEVFYAPSQEKPHLDFPQEAMPLSCNLMSVWGDNYLPWQKKPALRLWEFTESSKTWGFFSHLLSDTSLVQSFFPLILVLIYSFNFQVWLGKISTTGHEGRIRCFFFFGFGWVFAAAPNPLCKQSGISTWSQPRAELRENTRGLPPSYGTENGSEKPGHLQAILCWDDLHQQDQLCVGK